MPRTRGGVLWRGLLAAVIVIALGAAATAVAGLNQFHDIAKDFDQSAPIKDARIKLPEPGAPETLLLIGSDHRAGTPYTDANTDTMMLVRIDDSSSTINLMSIPRDLAVTVPGSGGEVQKLNAMYSIGGPNLLIKTLQQEVFPGLQVNHILDLNFAGFSDLIDAIGCVYTMVDHRYYNVSAPGPDDFSAINIQPGYQRLCGDHQAITGALAFVRFRHTDSDVVRNARQQDFIRWAKDGYGANQLLDNKGKLLKIFGKHVQTDAFLHTEVGLIELFDLIINADGHTLKTIQFPEYFGACGSGGPCYVYACPAVGACTGDSYYTTAPATTVGEATPAEEAAYTAFLTPTTGPAPSANTATPPSRKHRRHAAVSDAGLIADLPDGVSQARALKPFRLPIYVPKEILAGSQYCSSVSGNCDDPLEPAPGYIGSYPRRYTLLDLQNQIHPAYVMTLVINPELGTYYTVEGMGWQNPPILNSPNAVATVDGKRLDEYDDGAKIALVAWHTPQAVYWIANTLANAIPNREMVAIAASFTLAR
jgi:polyisoprenyl-teichoic acid--peptidoglycan teichoic acid transferase